TNMVDLSGTDWTQIDIGSVERVEIVNSPQSVLYGDNANGGVINIVTKKGGGKPSIGVDLAAGSYGYKSLKTYVSGGSSFLDYFGSYGASYTDGYRVNNYLDTSDYNFQLTIKPTTVAHINVSAGYHNDWYGMPGALTRQNIDQYGRRGSTHPDDRAKTEDKFANFGPELRWDMGGNILTFVTEFTFRERRTSTRTYDYAFNNTPWDQENHIITRGITPRATYTTQILGRELKLLTGLDYYYDRDNILSGDPTFVYSPSGKSLITIEKESLGMYGTAAMEIVKSLFANIGGRGEWTNYDFDQQSYVQGTSKRYPKDYAWEAGLNYRYGERSSVYTNVSRSYRLPAVDEWYSSLYNYYGLAGGGLNLGLKPQTQMNYEFGVKDQTLKFLSFAGSVYFMDVHKELYYNPMTGSNEVYDHTKHNGFTFESHFYPEKLSRNIKDVAADIFGRYTYCNAYFSDGSFAGNLVPAVSRNRITAGVNLTYLQSVTFSYLMHYVGPSYLISDQANTGSPLKGYCSNDVKLSYKKYGFEMFGSINNIFNAQYCEYGAMNSTGTTENFYPSPGRTLLGGVKYAF
ncbi:MAG: TonB-dependent receptor, partial [Candidatus Omnitrophota bacterium]